MAPKTTKVGVIGCGNICGIYFQTSKRLENLEVMACADIIPERAQAAVREHGVPKACSNEELLADPEIQIVFNLTNPTEHTEVTLAAIRAGKSVYSEKPLALNREDGRKILKAAKAKGVRVGCAPDTFLGGGIQTCRKLIDDGWIGAPVAAAAFFSYPGHERWHPDPEFFYKPGGGPMFDMGPYYLTALVTLLGPVRRVSGMTRMTFPERSITSAKKFGQKIKVEVQTHVAGSMEFASGAIGTIITSFDVWATHLPQIEIYGTAGSLSVPDPNTFGGPVQFFRANGKEWQNVALTHGHAQNSRALGAADMAAAIRSGRPHRASGDLAYHVLDLMQAFHDSANEGRAVEIKSVCRRPAALPLGLRDSEIDK